MKTIITAAIASLAISAGPALAQEGGMPFGSPEDVAYAELIWTLMEAERLAGPNMIRAFPYEGTDPHGMMLETFYDVGTINGHTGDLIVKRNFGPEGVSADEVLANPEGHLGAYTVMFRREAGYDPENLNWFWARYNPDGSVSQNPMGMALAGRVAKGMDEGCIACHQAAADDMVFTSDHLIAN
ncbi:cytochrome P460 family protein [Yoonia sp.]|uniref:cytochrome P460 family protein n=1 Tax=Yoonia sp. TaxID=2212373 RepID=UPI0019DD2918|nr:cytochrome P460 family protein [Yoonia sp.]MBE0414542.1 cytochrome P460 family protein [Yoonia sp.]